MTVSIATDSDKQIKAIAREVQKQVLYRVTPPIKLMTELAKNLGRRPWVDVYDYHIVDAILTIYTKNGNKFDVSYECSNNSIIKSSVKLISSNQN